MPKKDVSVAHRFAHLPDRRMDRTKKHSLTDILVIVLCAVMCGADSWEEVEAFGDAATRYYLTSLRGTAAELGKLIRRHWSIENELHWCLDVSFREDINKTAAGYARANLGLERRVAASLLKQDTGKGSIKAKRLRAGWDDDYRLQALQGFIED